MTEVAARYNSGKPELYYLLEFPTPIEAVCRVKELGAAKYDRGNWKKGGKPDREYISACLRHLLAFQSGEYYADDSGCAHLAHAMWNIMALMELNYKGQVINQELFDKMIEHWSDKDQPVPTVSIEPCNEVSAEDFVKDLNKALFRELDKINRSPVRTQERNEDETYEGGGHDTGFAD